MIYAGCMLLGLVAGFLSALLGIGGGFVVVPMLVILFAMDMKVAIGTSLAYIVPIALSGGIQHGLNRNIDFRVVAIAVPFGFVGTYLGVKLCGALPAATLRRIFGLLVMVIGLMLLLMPAGWQGLFGARGPGAGGSSETAAETESPGGDTP